MKTIDPHLAGAEPGDSFGARMLASRTHAGLARKDAANRIGLSLGQLGRIERGGVQMVNYPGTASRAAHIYGVPSVWLYACAQAGSRFVPPWYRAPSLELAA